MTTTLPSYSSNGWDHLGLKSVQLAQINTKQLFCVKRKTSCVLIFLWYFLSWAIQHNRSPTRQQSYQSPHKYPFFGQQNIEIRIIWYYNVCLLICMMRYGYLNEIFICFSTQIWVFSFTFNDFKCVWKMTPQITCVNSQTCNIQASSPPPKVFFFPFSKI